LQHKVVEPEGSLPEVLSLDRIEDRGERRLGTLSELKSVSGQRLTLVS